MTSQTDDVAWMEIYASTKGEGDRVLYFDNVRMVAVTGADTTPPAAPTAIGAILFAELLPAEFFPTLTSFPTAVD